MRIPTIVQQALHEALGLGRSDSDRHGEVLPDVLWSG
jgi:hypothetical protein